MNRKELDKKCVNVILFLCDELGGKIIGKKKLYKLLYYIDFDRYEFKESMKSITGNTYVAWKMGPVPVAGDETIKRMKELKLIKEDEVCIAENMHNAVVYTAQEKPDMSLFSEDEKFIMKRVVKKYGQLTGKQLEILTHAEAPFIATEQNEVMNYGLAFYRGTNFDDTVV